MTDEHSHHDHPPLANGDSPRSDEPEQFADPGRRHLAAALRTSFWLLGAMMILGVAAFLAMGIEFVEPGEVAIRTVFGEVVGTTEKGLAYNWPSPIGRIETISVGERTIQVDDFWLHERPEDLAKDLRKRTPPRGGLRPGWDGALLTGDRNLLHMRIKCTYAVSRQWDPNVEMDPVLQFRIHVKDPNETMRSVLCGAAIRAAAIRTADGLQRTERAAFETDVRKRAQQHLSQLRSGIVVRTVKVEQSTWPLRTLADYDAAQRAVSKAETLKSKAMSEAIEILTAAAGQVAYRRLVGDPQEVTGLGTRSAAAQTSGKAEEDYNLIGQYDKAVRGGDPARAKALLERIDSVLLSGTTGGEGSRIIAQADAYATGTKEAVKRRVRRFNDLLPEYEKAPEFMIDRLWQETREAILSSPTVEKHYVTVTGKGQMILRVNRDPDIVKQIRRAGLKTKQANETGASGRP